MITYIKRKDVGKLVGESIYDTPLYNTLDQAADKIRAIYTLFGWVHMLDDMHHVDDTLIGLVSDCAEDLRDNPKQKSANRSTAGIKVELYESGDFDSLALEVSFNIIS